MVTSPAAVYSYAATMSAPRSLVCAALALLAAACTVIPTHGLPTYEEREVAVHYALTEALPRSIRVPSSRPGLVVLQLETEPSGMPETFVGDERWLQVTAPALTIHCRYRVYAPPDGAGALPTPADLFPDATSIDTVWKQRGGHGAETQ